uniref:Uncharacterized protein n=1 Tax=Anguilla anguilla TaxID=7936 RepID=A0A0E9R3D4_ANGAN
MSHPSLYSRQVGDCIRGML